MFFTSCLRCFQQVPRIFAGLALAILLAACDPRGTPLPPPLQSGELVVITRSSPTTFFENAEGNYAGLEHDLVEMFAKELGLRVLFITASQVDILPGLLQNKAHFAAAGLSITPERAKQVRFSLPYQAVQQQVVYNSDMVRPRDLKDLVGKQIEVVAGSSYVERLKEAKKQLPGLSWRENKTATSDELLDRLASGVIDAVIVDSNIFDIAQNFRTNLKVAFSFGGPEQLAWAFPKYGDPFLFTKSQEFFKRVSRDGRLVKLIDRYYGHVKRLEDADVAGILTKMNMLLPKYRKLFHQAQELTDIDWRLLAAVSYQESHWDTLATSPTNVRGLMMLTEDTADHLGVTDRLDPKQSIPAGARYIQSIKDSLPLKITEPDRTWIALSAYNTGYGHIEDARMLAKRLKLNPDSWTDLKKALPLLAKSEYHDSLRHGYARGGEAVIFVENLRTYYDILAKFEKAYQPMFPLASNPYALVQDKPAGQRPSLSKPPK
jgi:membrane-bound lytic murein transglycosylase F